MVNEHLTQFDKIAQAEKWTDGKAYLVLSNYAEYLRRYISNLGGGVILP
jgi:hypothetical protein